MQWLQPLLWPAVAYGGLLVAALAVALGIRWLASCRLSGSAARPVGRACLAGVSAAMLGFAYAGLSALHQQADVLAPQLEDRPMWLTGTVADLPQSYPDGLMLVVAVDMADSNGQTVVLPRRVRLFWPAAPAGVQAGEVWRWPVRLRAPHGLANPHGFDRELWLWEQRIGATGVVRSGRQVPAPEAMGRSDRYFIDRWRGELTAAVRERVQDARSAGIMAALLVGNQSAIGGVR